MRQAVLAPPVSDAFRYSVMRLALLGVAVALAILAGAITARDVSAEPNETNRCWGVVTSQAATSDPGFIGEHASEQEEPRRGLGNLARDLGFDSMGEFGSFLAEIDGIEATSCP